MDSLVWLHLSDLHYCPARSGWDARRLHNTLKKDLAELAHDEGLVPDLIFFTGDLAFGQIPEQSIDVQFEAAIQFLDELRSIFDPAVPRNSVFIVPGNHDVNRQEISVDQTEWLTEHGDFDTVTASIRTANVQWRRYMDRLKDYRVALEDSDYIHLLSDPVRLIYGITRDIRGLRIGIAGLNTAWSCSAADKKGNLFIGARWQVSELAASIEKSDIRIGLTHHPAGWATEHEEPEFSRLMEREFDFHLHGHEHSDWVNVSTAGHVRIAAAACYERSDRENGYNITRLDLASGEAEVWLRRYDTSGGGWVARPVAKHARDGTWRIPGLASLSRAREHKAERDSIDASPSSPGTSGRWNPSIASASSGSQKTVKPDDLDLARPNSVGEFVACLEDRFGFGWQRIPSPDAMDRPLVYWPVRLRAPTCIHAVQCFAAAGLQKLGADVILCLDDLGNVEYNPQSFLQAAQYWFERAGGEPSKLELRLFSDVVGRQPNEAWPTIQRWLANNVHYMDTVLKVSKLWPDGSDPNSIVNAIGRSRPRRLLTPPMVWACLLVISAEMAGRPAITLGGRDEEQLWRAARTCDILPHTGVSHLFIPELQRAVQTTQQNIHMADTPLDWTSKEAIRQTLLDGLADARSGNATSYSNTVIPWCARGCVFLPSFVKGTRSMLTVSGRDISDIDQIAEIEPAEVIDPLVEAIARWIL